MQRNVSVVSLILTVALGLCSPSIGAAASITLQNATATFAQAAQDVGQSINGIFADGDGWAIFPNTTGQTAVFETASDVGSGGHTTLTFSLYQFYSLFPPHTIGRLRLSATTDERSTFADGLSTSGDVTANWTVLTPMSALSTNGATMTTLGDLSILVGGPSPATDIYTIIADTALQGITGIRLEVLEDLSLPDSGPGRAYNGNFVLTEFELDASPTAVPEPATLTMLALGAVALCLRRRRGGREDRGEERAETS